AALLFATVVLFRVRLGEPELSTRIPPPLPGVAELPLTVLFEIVIVIGVFAEMKIPAALVPVLPLIVVPFKVATPPRTSIPPPTPLGVAVLPLTVLLLVERVPEDSI